MTLSDLTRLIFGHVKVKGLDTKQDILTSANAGENVTITNVGGVPKINSTGASSSSAADISYDNTNSGSSATNPQEAIDDLYSKIGSSGGVAELDDNGKVPSSQLPSYVDDVLEFADASAFPGTGESGKIYVDLSANKTYRWSGSSYTPVGSDLALGETSSTAYRGDRGKIAYDDSQTNKAAIGALSNLSTTAKSDLVSAINEVKSAAGSGGGSGSSIPSGGTTGQVLTKKSNTDGDVEWQDVTFDEISVIDAEPTEDSEHLVTSGGVYLAISAAIGQALNTSY